MTLREWIATEGISYSEAGRRLGVSPGHIGDMLAERFWPGRETMRKIFERTDGQVTPNDFLGLAAEQAPEPVKRRRRA
jgi:3,4-dihydroxy 2-butanone 4-phosphate synthase/GTP cyclohydrolase II